MPPKWGHFFTLTERMAVAILEEVNNHADAEFKRLKDIGGGHTIYRMNETALDETHGAKLAKIELKKKVTGRQPLGRVGQAT